MVDVVCAGEEWARKNRREKIATKGNAANRKRDSAVLNRDCKKECWKLMAPSLSLSAIPRPRLDFWNAAYSTTCNERFSATQVSSGRQSRELLVGCQQFLLGRTRGGCAQQMLQLGEMRSPALRPPRILTSGPRVSKLPICSFTRSYCTQARLLEYLFTSDLLDPAICPACWREHFGKENQGLYFVCVEGDEGTPRATR